MSESYTIGGDTLHQCDNPNWAGQTFRPQETHILDYIDLEMRGPLVVPEPVIQVFHADWNHEPTGDAISRNRFTTEKHCSLITTGRVRFSMSPYTLHAGDYYVIVVSHHPALGAASAYWLYDKDDATYPRGMRISTTDSGVTWTKHYDDDHIFVEFGNPPLPKPEPPPPINNFATLDLDYAYYPTSIHIVLSTSVPCHLWCYYTDKVPRKHRRARTIRGVIEPWATYFCFVGWKKVEQNEPGDTLYHTFEVPDWSYCQTNWFTFRGEVALIDVPSVGPIFKKHHPGVPTIATFLVAKKAYYRTFRSATPGDPDLLYIEAHDQEQADSYHELVILYGQRIRVIGTYAAAMLRRKAIIFNTTIPPPIQLIKATLRLDIRKTSPPAGYSANWDWDLKIRAGQDLNSEIIHGDLVNYSRILALGTEVASKYADDLPDPGYRDDWYINIPLAYINIEGQTIFTSLTSKDETRTRPDDNKVEEALFIADNHSRLVIEYYQQ